MSLTLQRHRRHRAFVAGGLAAAGIVLVALAVVLYLDRDDPQRWIGSTERVELTFVCRQLSAQGGPAASEFLSHGRVWAIEDPSTIPSEWTGRLLAGDVVFISSTRAVFRNGGQEVGLSGRDDTNGKYLYPARCAGDQ